MKMNTHTKQVNPVKSKQVLYHIMAIVTVIIWGTTFVSTKVLIREGLTPVEILMYRFTIAYICIWFISPKKLFARNWKDELWMIGMGLTGGSLYFVTENTALGITLASNVSLILCTTPILVAFIAWGLNRKEKLRKNLLIGSFIALAGVALVVFNGNYYLKINPLGDFLTFISALMWAFYCLILKRMNTKYPTLLLTRKVFFYGVVTLFPLMLIFPGYLSITINTEILSRSLAWINLLFLGIVASMLCFIMWNIAVKELGPVYTSNYIYIVPLVTVFASSLILDEPVTFVSLIGAALILYGVYFVEKRG
ncbi:MAG: DMT family transporter [Tannerellaceae bacterium]|nr:DMT family transporter [Tannerellaceae bacterium]